MNGVRFIPWIGSQYAKAGLSGLRVLVVCDSHYGPKHAERTTVTPEIIMALGQMKVHPSAVEKLPGHPHFARIMTSVLNMKSAKSLDKGRRVDFWESVSYYNFVQEFMPRRRRRPSKAAWKDAATVFPKVLDTLAPHVVLGFGKEMCEHLKPLVSNASFATLRHPSAGYEYAVWNPVVQGALSNAASSVAVDGADSSGLLDSATFKLWEHKSRVSLPAHGMRIPEDAKAAVRAAWAASFAQ